MKREIQNFRNQLLDTQEIIEGVINEDLEIKVAQRRILRKTESRLNTVIKEFEGARVEQSRAPEYPGSNYNNINKVARARTALIFFGIFKEDLTQAKLTFKKLREGKEVEEGELSYVYNVLHKFWKILRR